jgi:ribosomal protein S18 acetylase RimI-like enzyme
MLLWIVAPTLRQSYLEPAAGTALLEYLSSSFSNATAVLYDPLALNDAFGETLQQYFAIKGCELLSLRQFQTPLDHCDRLLRLAKWKTCRVIDMNAVFDAATSPDEKTRVQALEPFDEYADWVVCNAHYGLLLATTQCVPLTHWSQQFCATRGFAAQRVDIGTDGSCQTMVLRTFQPDDLKQVQALFQSTHLDYACKAVAKFVKNRVRAGDLADIEASFFSQTSGSHFWVIEASVENGGDREIVGCIGLKPHESAATTAELCRLSVATAVRRRGLASRLVATLEEFASQSGYKAIHLDTIESMEAAQGFYRARGYTEAAARTKFSTFTLVSFSKTL